MRSTRTEAAHEHDGDGDRHGGAGDQTRVPGRSEQMHHRTPQTLGDDRRQEHSHQGGKGRAFKAASPVLVHDTATSIGD